MRDKVVLGVTLAIVLLLTLVIYGAIDSTACREALALPRTRQWSPKARPYMHSIASSATVRVVRAA